MNRLQVAEKLGVTKEALNMVISRIERDQDSRFPQTLGLEQYCLVLDAYSKPNSRRPAEITEKAKRLKAAAAKVETTTNVQSTSAAAAQVVVNINQAEPKAEPTPKPKAHASHKSGSQSNYQADVRNTPIAFRVFLYTVFVCVLAWQIHHTALLEFSISKFGGNWAVFLACVYAVGVQFTALLLTIRKASKKFLVGAAVCEFGINILCYYPHTLLAVILVSAISAFTIYSYSELFISK